MKFIKGKLHINSAPYRKRIEPPTPEDYLSLNCKQIDEILQIPINRGDQICEKRGEFVGFCKKPFPTKKFGMHI